MRNRFYNPKKIAAEKAVEFIKDGMIVGLGTGSTAEFAIRKLGKLVSEGLKIRCVPTSHRTERLAAKCGIPLCDIDKIEIIDVTIDGADEVDPNFNLIKGLGGALLREKIVASVTEHEIIVVDDTKLVPRLGTRSPIPVEVLKFGVKKTIAALQKLGCKPTLRTTKRGDYYITDNGNYIVDCRFVPLKEPKIIEEKINVIPGVLENGIFIELADTVIVGHPDGTNEIKSKSKR